MSAQAIRVPELQDKQMGFAEVVGKLARVKMKVNIQEQPRVISLFSGAGGMDLGFKKAGFDIIFANDFDKDACETYKLNIDDNILHCDISTIKNDDIPKNIDVLIGGFPCQAFSSAGKRKGFSDIRGTLFFDIIRILKAKKPQGFILENVDGLVNHNEGKTFNVIIDPFCGCGTTVISAQNNKRKWIGIDICMLAVNSVEARLQQLFPLLQKGKDYRLDGLPTTVEQAIELARSSNTTKNEGRYQFQYWAIEKVGGFASTKKSGDGGVDGSIYFYKDMEGKKLGKMIISVKSDKKITMSYVRDLVGTLSNDNTAEMAGLLFIDEPTDGMRQECLKAGFYEIDYGMMGVQKFPKVQILTVKDIIENNKTFQTPFKVQKKIAEHSNKKNKVFIKVQIGYTCLDDKNCKLT